jgi:hypothetical protein
VPRNPFDAIKAKARRQLAAYSVAELMECSEDNLRRMDRIIALRRELD